MFAFKVLLNLTIYLNGDKTAVSNFLKILVFSDEKTKTLYARL